MERQVIQNAAVLNLQCNNIFWRYLSAGRDENSVILKIQQILPELIWWNSVQYKEQMLFAYRLTLNYLTSRRTNQVNLKRLYKRIEKWMSDFSI